MIYSKTLETESFDTCPKWIERNENPLVYHLNTFCKNTESKLNKELEDHLLNDQYPEQCFFRFEQYFDQDKRYFLEKIYGSKGIDKRISRKSGKVKNSAILSVSFPECLCLQSDYEKIKDIFWKKLDGYEQLRFDRLNLEGEHPHGSEHFYIFLVRPSDGENPIFS